jgi:hypothetical protein
MLHPAEIASIAHKFLNLLGLRFKMVKAHELAF